MAAAISDVSATTTTNVSGRVISRRYTTRQGFPQSIVRTNGVTAPPAIAARVMLGAVMAIVSEWAFGPGSTVVATMSPLEVYVMMSAPVIAFALRRIATLSAKSL